MCDLVCSSLCVILFRRRYWKNKQQQQPQSSTTTTSSTSTTATIEDEKSDPSTSKVVAPSPPVANATANLQVLLIRHAESYNNALADELEAKYGKCMSVFFLSFFLSLFVPFRYSVSSFDSSKTQNDTTRHHTTPTQYNDTIQTAAYEPHSDQLRNYLLARMSDPILSSKGKTQAALLPQHPYLHRIGLNELARRGRVELFASPLTRAIETADALARELDLQVFLFRLCC